MSLKAADSANPMSRPECGRAGSGVAIAGHERTRETKLKMFRIHSDLMDRVVSGDRIGASGFVVLRPARLAGEQGRAIVARVPHTTRNGWWLIARTKIIDDVIAQAIADGCDRVLNLAAGRTPGRTVWTCRPIYRGWRRICRNCWRKRPSCLPTRHRDAN